MANEELNTKPYKYIKMVSDGESTERKILHVANHTILLLMFGSEKYYSIRVKEGVHTTFGDFYKDLRPICFTVDKKLKNDAVDMAMDFLKTKSPELHHLLTGHSEPQG